MTHRQVLVVLGGLLAGMFLAALDQTLVAVALPTIAGELGQPELMAWIVTAYLLAATAATPLFGRISDVHGRSRVFQAAILIFLAGAVLSAVSVNMPMLVVARAVQGVGGGGVMALAMTILGDILSPRERGRYQGYIGAMFGFASVAGPLVGGFVIDHLTWRALFLLHLPVGVLALVVTTRALRLPHHRVERAVDYLGGALLVAGVSSLLLAIAWGGTTMPWTSPVILGLLTGGLVLAGLFSLRQRSAPEPIIPPGLFSSPTFSLVAAGGFVIGATTFGTIVILPVYLQLVGGESATASGLLLTPLMAGVIVSSVVSGRRISATGRYRRYPIAGALLMTLALALLVSLDTSTDRLTAGLMLAVFGIGIGLVIQNLILIAQNDVPAADLGAATATVNFTRMLGGAVGTALLGAVLTSGVARRLAATLEPGVHLDVEVLRGSPAAVQALDAATRAVVVDAYAGAVSTVMLIAAIASLATVVLMAMLPERPLRDTPNVGARNPGAPPHLEP